MKKYYYLLKFDTGFFGSVHEDLIESDKRLSDTELSDMAFDFGLQYCDGYGVECDKDGNELE